MNRTQRGRRRDPIEQAMELALRLEDFIDYGAVWSFVSELEEVEQDIQNLLREEPARAVALYETFIAGCYEKTEEIDDSSSVTVLRRLPPRGRSSSNIPAGRPTTSS